MFKVPPTIEILSPVKTIVNESDPVSFYCKASGFPQPTIAWSKLEDGTAIFPGGNDLNYTSVNRTDSGTYICTATNGVLGPATASATLLVQCK